jgi:hypothetical protein
MSTTSAPAPEIYKLIALQGPDRGREFFLEPGRTYVAGRSEECQVRLDAADKTVSRQHARITAGNGKIRIESLSAANPVQVKGKPLPSADLKPKDQFRIGETLMVFEKTGGKGDSTIGGKKMLLFAVLGAACLLLVAVMMIAGSGEKASPPETGGIPTEVREPAPPAPKPETALPEPSAGLPTPASGITVSPEDMKAADQHFRQGMFFYDTGNLARAVEEWNRAVVLHPEHPDARVWFLRAEKELEEQVKTHYQNAMTHYKYMRYKDAAQEFRIVVELSRNKTGDQYVNALKTLNELEGR